MITEPAREKAAQHAAALKRRCFQGFFLRAGEWVGAAVGDRGGGVSGVLSAIFCSRRCLRVFAS